MWDGVTLDDLWGCADEWTTRASLIQRLATSMEDGQPSQHRQRQTPVSTCSARWCWWWLTVFSAMPSPGCAITRVCMYNAYVLGTDRVALGYNATIASMHLLCSLHPLHRPLHLISSHMLPASCNLPTLGQPPLLLCSCSRARRYQDHMCIPTHQSPAPCEPYVRLPCSMPPALLVGTASTSPSIAIQRWRPASCASHRVVPRSLLTKR